MEKIEAGVPGGGFPVEIDPIEISWDNSSQDYYYVVVENMEENPVYINSRLAELLAVGEKAKRSRQISKPEITDYKHQISNKFQIRSTANGLLFVSLVIEICLFFVFCYFIF